MSVLGRGLATLATSALLAPAALAVVPAPERVQDAIAETNVAAGRTVAVRLELSLQIGDRPAVASGELVSHPTGLARLELRGTGDLVERHLLQGSELSVSRNGLPIEESRVFLPPYFILQSDTGTTLRAALESFGILADVLGLGECGDADCLVFGDPSREVPRPEPAPVLGLERYGEPAAPEDEAGEEPRPGGAGGEPDLPIARLWVDARSYEVRGVDSADGVKIRFGPVASFDDLRVPAWIHIEQPGKAPARLDVMRATQVNAPASAFSREWLLTPVAPQDELAR